MLITHEAERQEGIEMYYRSIISQIMNIFMEQRSFDWNMDQEQNFVCRNEISKMDIWHRE